MVFRIWSGHPLGNSWPIPLPKIVQELRRSWAISLLQTKADQVEEDRRAGLRKAQREGCKIKMKTLQHFSSPMWNLRDVAQLGEFDMSSFAFCPQASTLPFAQRMKTAARSACLLDLWSPSALGSAGLVFDQRFNGFFCGSGAPMTSIYRVW